jgi:hypothetical protein
VKYATWKLDFTDPNYGTGPEETIVALGFSAEGAWIDGQVENGGTILGYVSEAQDEPALAAWNFTNVTDETALAFCLAINPEAYFLEDGRITVPPTVLPTDLPTDLPTE